ncbi:14415_t:CDS:2 [Funneliformis geosporum]|uniref:14415_t:CDS:1 n=1 Tax=Funneliformis geosporum TaxID=1117311 RepID=A0A9W4WKB1_9GLOM|nr:14415_t:CDS:2 [Funneliformis geosporum]
MSLESMKIFLLLKHDLPLNWVMELFYLALTLCQLAIYTYFAFNDLGPNPFLCPVNYPYPSKELYNVCIIDLSNLICMWLMFSISLCFAIRDNIPNHKIDEWLGFQNNDQSDNVHNKSWEGEEKEGKQVEGVA